jgi:WD40 repeat protein
MLYPSGQEELKNLNLDFHQDSVNSIAFTKTLKHYLISGGADKSIMVWKINFENFSSEKSKLIKSQSEVTDIAISNNDEYFFTACIDNHIYVYKSNFLQRDHSFFLNISIHTNIITSISLHQEDNSNSIKFASYSDEGRLIISELIPGEKPTVIKDYVEFVNSKNKINSIQKKIE